MATRLDPKLVRLMARLKARSRIKRRVFVGQVTLSDPERAPDILDLLRRAPKHSVVVWRTAGLIPGLAQIKALKRMARTRRLHLLVTGPVSLAVQLRAGLYLPARWQPKSAAARVQRVAYLRGSQTLHLAGAHNSRDLQRWQGTAVAGYLVSKLAASPSRGAGRVLGPLKWRLLAGHAKGHAIPLGGVSGKTLRRIHSADHVGFAKVGL